MLRHIRRWLDVWRKPPRDPNEIRAIIWRLDTQNYEKLKEKDL